MPASAPVAIDSIAVFFAERGYAVGASSVGSALMATRRARGLGPFFPYTDFVFIHDLSSAREGSASFALLHEQARAFAESQFRLPRPLRYHIPNTVSIGVSEVGFSAEAVDFARERKLRSQFDGGEKNSTYLLDLGARTMYSQGFEATPVRYGGTIVTVVNPTNRIHVLMTELAEMIFEG